MCPLFGTHNTLSYPDKFADREIWELLAVCENKESGCTWTDRLKHFEVNLLISSGYLVACVTSEFSESFKLRF